MRALLSENSSRSAFSPRFGTVKTTLSNSSVVEGMNGTMTSRERSCDMLSTTCCMAAVSISGCEASTPVVSFTVCRATMEP